MSNDFRSIGLVVEEASQLADLAARSVEHGERRSVALGTYHRWPVGDGAELWVTTDRDGAILGAGPHGRTDHRVQLALQSRITRRDMDNARGPVRGVGRSERGSVGGLAPSRGSPRRAGPRGIITPAAAGCRSAHDPPSNPRPRGRGRSGSFDDPEPPAGDQRRTISAGSPPARA